MTCCKRAYLVLHSRLDESPIMCANRLAECSATSSPRYSRCRRYRRCTCWASLSKWAFSPCGTRSPCRMVREALSEEMVRQRRRQGQPNIDVLLKLIETLSSGRSVSACQRAYTRVRSRANFPPPPRPLGAPEGFGPLPKPRKRPSTGEVSTPSHGTPGFSSFPSVNNPSPAHGLPSLSQSPGGRQQKKRGRPSKAEHELRAAEAAARGEPYPPPKKVRTPKPSTEQGSSTATMDASGSGEAPGTSGYAAFNTSTPSAQAPYESQIGFQAAATAANEVGQTSQGAAKESGNPESPSKSLLAGLQAHATRTENTGAEPVEQQQQQQQPTAQPTPHLEPYPRAPNEAYQTPYEQSSGV